MRKTPLRKAVRFGLIGCGAMGSAIASAFDRGEVAGKLSCVYDNHADKAHKLAEGIREKPVVCDSFSALLKRCDFIIEAASQDAVKMYVVPALKAGKSVLVMSVGALLERALLDKVAKAAAKSGAKVYLPSGAVAGVDGLLAGACAGIVEVTLTTTKPPASLAGVEYLEERGIDVYKISSPTVLYEGPAEEAVKLFPKNINVAAIVSLASGAVVKVRIIADPNTDRNTHEICARGSFGEITTKASNVPSPSNPKTSYLACLSTVATLKQVVGSVKLCN